MKHMVFMLIFIVLMQCCGTQVGNPDEDEVQPAKTTTSKMEAKPVPPEATVPGDAAITTPTPTPTAAPISP